MRSSLQHPPRGFTALELIFSIALMAMLFALTLMPFRAYREAQTLNSAALEIASLLADARSASIASKESSQYGVHFEPARVVYFKGASFAEPSSYNKELVLSSLITIASTTLSGGGDDIVFDQLTGATSNAGTVIIRAASDASKQKTITVTATGAISND